MHTLTVLLGISASLMIGFTSYELGKQSLVKYIILFFGIFLLLFSCIIDLKEDVKQASIDALKGKNHYEMRINYTLKNDSTYVPTDTVYFEIKK